MNNISASQKSDKALATDKETILDLQTFKIIDSVVEKNNEDVMVMLSIKF